jgi:hypothetical protein
VEEEMKIFYFLETLPLNLKTSRLRIWINYYLAPDTENGVGVLTRKSKKKFYYDSSYDPLYRMRLKIARIVIMELKIKIPHLEFELEAEHKQ